MPTWTTEGKCNTYVVSVQFLSETERSLLFKASVITSVLGNWVWNLPLLKFQFLSFLPAFLSLKLLLLTHFLELLVSFQIQSTTVSSLLLYSPSLGGKQEKVFDMLPVCLLLYTLYFGFWDDREQGEKPGCWMGSVLTPLLLTQLLGQMSKTNWNPSLETPFQVNPGSTMFQLMQR